MVSQLRIDVAGAVSVCAEVGRPLLLFTVTI
jgi:hypothetical protein